MVSDLTRVGVIGAGAWGTALAILAHRAGNFVHLWSRNPNVLDSVRAHRSNENYLPGVFIDPAIQVTDDLALACRADVLLVAIPSQSVRSTCIALSDLIDTQTPIVLATKGIERGSLMLMSEIVQQILPENPVAILSGPNFADEAARGLPTATTLACADTVLADKLLFTLGGKWFRPYVSNDVIGAQVGGAVKNVIAIAAGIVIGRGLGENAKAALITRGLAEISRLCLIKGGKLETLMGLSGIGDVMLTCSSPKSRNMALGLAIGQGQRPSVASSPGGKGLTEGVFTADSVTDLARKLGISMPICQAVHQILYQNADVEETLHTMLERPFTMETSLYRAKA